MKSSLKKLRGFGLHKSDSKEKRGHQPHAKLDELVQASQDMQDMRNCYDSLLSAAAATANSAYEFSEALQEMGTCLLEKTALNDDEESGRVLLMLGKAQFELQKLVDIYRSHVIQTITTPSESLLKELQVVEEMKRQCDDKKDTYKSMLAAHREKGRSKNGKGETVSSQQLQAAQEDYEEEATLFVFRLKSLKQGQSRSLLTQAARHHASQINFFRKGLKSLEVVEPHVKVVAEQQHIDYQFSGLEDNDTEDYEDDDYGYDDSDDDELSFDYGQNDHVQDILPRSRNSMELDYIDLTATSTSIVESAAQDTVDRSQAEFTSSRGSTVGSQSAPIFPDKKFDSSEKLKEMQASSTRKFHTYVLPTPGDTKGSTFMGFNNPVSKSQTPVWHSSPLEPNKYGYGTKEQSVLKESNLNSGPIKLPRLCLRGCQCRNIIPQIVSATKKIKRQAFSGPITSKAWSSKPIFSAYDSMPSVEYPHIISARQTLSPTHQTSVSAKYPQAPHLLPVYHPPRLVNFMSFQDLQSM
ncbi:hypothetical protein J5N97_021537 [Dioscorea zingiberensis]|uniref:BAR domain-containing protein n=1 Tax=Dioscorea zingiberensis TaxID=325984 RepID=A0A9D5HEP7_9LILI|nr:hypothetical protein J5N97_021537 [Dioscorea zingiberensis]